jgi:hypothetical protein
MLTIILYAPGIAGMCVIAAVVIAVVAAILNAPQGYENEDGFHLGGDVNVPGGKTSNEKPRKATPSRGAKL